MSVQAYVCVCVCVFFLARLSFISNFCNNCFAITFFQEVIATPISRYYQRTSVESRTKVRAATHQCEGCVVET